MKYSKQEQADAIERLREVIKPGDTVYTILRHRSSSGMSRVIDVKVIHAEVDNSDTVKPRVYHIGYSVAIALGLSYDREREGVKVSGCGMDMGYHIVHELGNAIFGTGDECAKHGYVSERNGDTGPEKTGGYLLNHAWL